MRCDDVIHELAAPTGDRQTTAVPNTWPTARPAPAGSQGRAAQLDQLWKRLAPGAVAPGLGLRLGEHRPNRSILRADRDRDRVACALAALPQRTSSRSKILAHPASVPRPARSRTWRPPPSPGRPGPGRRHRDRRRDCLQAIRLPGRARLPQIARVTTRRLLGFPRRSRFLLR